MGENRLEFLLSNSLIEAVKSQRCVLFLGAGASKEAQNANGNKPPDANQLRDILAEKFFKKAMPNRDVMGVAEMAIANSGSASQVYEEVRKAFTGYTSQAAHKLIPTFSWHAIATTNYDTIVEGAYEDSKIRVQQLVPIVKDDEPIDQRLREFANPVSYLKLHGCLNHIHDSDIPPILSREVYSTYSKNRTRLFLRLQDMAFEHTFIFVGYRLDDSHIRDLIYNLGPGRRPRWYMVTPNAEQEDIDFWATKNVELIRARFGDFMSALDKAIPPLFRRLSQSTDVSNFPIRRFYSTHSMESDATNRSLRTDLTFIHTEMPIEAQTAEQFYSGYDTGWGAIVNRYDVRRQVEEDILFKAVLENEVPDGPILIVVKGPAGSGKTVALKRSAYEAATASNVIALWFNADGALRPAVLDELHELTQKPIYLFVDDVALHADGLTSLLRHARANKLPLVVVGAERDSDWNTYCGDLEREFPGPELKVRYLSRREINGLLDLLEKHGCLGLLATETRDERIRQFETVAERQLLVALHQLTQGRPFEEVLRLEHQRVSPEQARQLYLDIATMHQYSVSARAGTISRISGISFSDYQQNFFAPLLNIVKAETDRYSGDYSYRTRHSRVAQLVFRQACSTDEQKADQFARIISGLDFGYSSDSRALEQITKGRSLANTFAEPEPGRRIYEAAISVAPNQAFIYQQWALFELHHPGGSLEEAERQANEAHKIDEKNTAVIHTQAEIDRIRATKVSSALMKDQLRRRARERLNSLSNNSPYAVSSRCKLLVDEIVELKRDLHDDGPEHEAIFFAEKTQEAENRIRLALQQFPDDPDIAQVEARFREEMDQEERALRALERALRLNPKGSGAAIRVARIYRSRHQSDAALRVLTEALASNSDDKALHAEMAKHHLSEASADDDVIESHLRRAFSTGDGNFEARFELGQFLFSRGEMVKAAALFEEIDKKAPQTFRPVANRENLFSKRIPMQAGYVQSISGHMFFVRSGAYPKEILAHKASIAVGDFEDITVGTNIRFTVRFNRKGPVATSIAVE
ncbi:P-loop NTPase [Rhizobium rhizogenes]|uniref:P-loop NTPase n=1 Tax=Rhizobium rhizogenes TaxID=359 RepID=UPI0015733F7F|nr:SIR2 family protein [Rhizobium rhizogenes]NTF55017.1 tetratricopeptide repeat protein [Rhizobium rhizogenes]NTF74597.1 tetratricopeptide repeat protein [Rhizobium rhizogenes]NTF98416.1 tetratricopeptide repeat protein [Rhizobium rhizogenes]NTH51018.1 tetratricopeptide repeat protein [Rhizobium rhizogenes]NTH70602.1 tetratricopeptide repeat protein [Rhizobium rhizogenes]